jgi:XTP/dITP diphosphohydrolase
MKNSRPFAFPRTRAVHFKSAIKKNLPMTTARVPSTILIGTTNSGKVRELSELFGMLPVELLGLKDTAVSRDIEETGQTFSENAALKARSYAAETGLFTLGDDSGLEVRALDNRPGIHSARYGGEDLAFPEKIRLLLKELAAIPNADRAARFVCAMSLADPSGKVIFEAEAVCEGTLAAGPRGSGGFGYDPIFVPVGYDLTFGELDDRIKQQISHRACAAAKIIRYLQGFLEV